MRACSSGKFPHRRRRIRRAQLLQRLRRPLGVGALRQNVTWKAGSHQSDNITNLELIRKIYFPGQFREDAIV